MRIAGVIAEYDPFHAGHAWQLAEIKRRGYDAVVCVVSPSVCQRGTVSFVPAAQRVHAALLAGADVVITLPSVYASASAEQFAAAGVHLLASTGCVQTLFFGAETPDTDALLQTAQLLDTPQFSSKLKKQLATGVSFATARAAAVEQFAEDAAQLLAQPNNILGVEYCKAILRQGTSLQPCALPRLGAGHHEDDAVWGFAGGSMLRKSWLADGVDAIVPFVPSVCVPLYREAQANGFLLSPQRFDVALLSRLRGMSVQQLAAVRGMNEGLENRFADALCAATTAQQLFNAVKSKRYAYTRVCRLALDAALGVGQQLPALPPYLHIAGAGDAGLPVLKKMQGTALLPLNDSLATLEKTSDAAAIVAQYHAMAADFAALCRTQIQPTGSAYTQKFVRV